MTTFLLHPAQTVLSTIFAEEDELRTMHTLAQLQSGSLNGAVSLHLREGLTEFPKAIFELADTLELLNLTGNNLTELPADFGRLKKLKILFCSDNLFTELPAVLADCPLLDIVGFKANKIAIVPAASLNPNIRWLILTDNCIAALPKEIGNCSRMQKLMLAGNWLPELPEELGNCRNLSLLRISANRLTQLPEWLLSMPRLSWLAFSGNLFGKHATVSPLPSIDWQELTIHHVIGSGASGIIYKGVMLGKTKPVHIAIKVFKGAVTSDGYPADEMNMSIAAGAHTGLVPLIGQIAGHPEGKQGLVMELIAESYKNLGLPPSFDSCTRDVFTAGTQIAADKAVKVAATIAAVAHHLHQKGIVHGDLYAHNTLTDDAGNTLLGDFGAASFYDIANTKVALALERLEVSAFGHLLDDLLSLCSETEKLTSPMLQLAALRDASLVPEVMLRPGFQQLQDELLKMLEQTKDND